MKALISVIMPTYNSAATIETALKSIRMQTVADQIEILVIDGGSTDATREIARRYGAIVLENPHRLPEPAKVIGVRYAVGQYIIKQDSDEELLYATQIEERINLFRRYPEVKCVVYDVQRPGAEGGIASRYVCTCGDPFTQFIYHQKKGTIDTFKKIR